MRTCTFSVSGWSWGMWFSSDKVIGMDSWKSTPCLQGTKCTLEETCSLVHWSQWTLSPHNSRSNSLSLLMFWFLQVVSTHAFGEGRSISRLQCRWNQTWMEVLDQGRADGDVGSSDKGLEECEQLPNMELTLYDSYCAIGCFKSKLILFLTS